MREVIYIDPGAYVTGQRLKHQYCTILGSCICMILWHPESHFFAMCHYLLVQAKPNNRIDTSIIGRYGDLILPYFLKLVTRAGVPLVDLEVSVYGGASSGKSEGLSSCFQVAARNIKFVEHFIHQHQIKLKNKDLGGDEGRKIWFDTETGECRMAKMTKQGVQL